MTIYLYNNSMLPLGCKLIFVNIEIKEYRNSVLLRSYKRFLASLYVVNAVQSGKFAGHQILNTILLSPQQLVIRTQGMILWNRECLSFAKGQNNKSQVKISETVGRK